MELAENIARYKFNYGKMLVALNRIQEGLPYLYTAIEFEPEDVEFHIGLSQVLINLNRLDEAKDVILETLSKNLESVKLMNNYGVILKKQGEIEQAIEKFEIALGIESTFSLALANLGECYLLKNDIKMAENKTLEALKYDPDNGQIRVLYAQILHRQRRYDKSIDEFNKSIALGFESPEVYANLVVAYYELGKMDKSDESMDRIKNIAPTSVSNFLFVAHYYISKLDLPRAKKNLEFILNHQKPDEISSEQEAILSNLADSAMHKRSFAIAEWSLEILSNIKPHLFSIWCNLGIARAELGKLVKAKEAIEKALELEPNNPALWHNKGNILKKLGDVEGSVKAYEKEKQLSTKMNQESS